MTRIAVSSRAAELPDLSDVLARRISVLGSTGSIGKNTLDVVAHARKVYGEDALPIEALTAQSNAEMLAAQARKFRPRVVAIGDAPARERLKDMLTGTGIEVGAGREAVIAAAARPSEVVMMAIVGAAALEPALAAVRRGATVALANKECIVAGGALLQDAIVCSGAAVIPVDSEHNAIFQVLNGGSADDVARVTLTASGGPFREWPLERMKAATPEQAIAHPNWSMGKKNSLDSATLMNKGLELIEAHYLFGISPSRLGVVVHPQSIVHCLVAYADGTTLAHLSMPDMRTPIAHAIAWPRRIAGPSPGLDLASVKALTFEAPDADKFPCLGLAEHCLRMGGRAPTILNAANEIAVEAFLGRRIGFLDIARVVEETLAAENAWNGPAFDLDSILATDRWARDTAGGVCARIVA
ncbi:MAG TPA: 1-deoxy-D-xylulose-5-phosphate reductoisomerase [Rhizomicrobium sp.]|nr:1-deoxy-D-xylulose-5-phosphate reductoisomerase [Rhizomicrobium sp.]